MVNGSVLLTLTIQASRPYAHSYETGPSWTHRTFVNLTDFTIEEIYPNPSVSEYEEGCRKLPILVRGAQEPCRERGNYSICF